ncbi:MAG: DUF885 domain-containing protein [Hyphomonadaceae bacterium]|nr:DUF885 domain-containing protein [Hyphomonadaceae bacterium]MBC6412438.1 DUF885 domain-containing protein [Hyphomonadaceae bacterium]
MPPLKTAITIGVLVLQTACRDGTAIRNEEPVFTDKSAALNAWFEARHEDSLARSPMRKTYLGMTDESSGRLDEVSQHALDETASLTRTWLEHMQREFDPDTLDEQTALSYRLFEYDSQDLLAIHKFADHDYVFQHMSGPHTGLPSFMINFHAVTTLGDAENYVSRLREFDRYLGQYQARAEAQAAKGVLLPEFVYPKIRDAARNVISGAPFTDGDDSPLFADIKSDIAALSIQPDDRDRLVSEARKALIDHVKPAYESLIAMFERHETLASVDDGVWKLPDGEAYYRARLKHFTTTDMTPDEIHEIGLADVARIHGEMRKIMERVGFNGTLQDFFTLLRTDPQFTYENTDAGRQRYIDEATAIIDRMRDELDALFITKPKADMIVKRVEPFREDTAFGAFYNQPAMDGSRPGIYYINLRDMNELPVYQMQALAYHEGIPGHHMQIAIAQELEGLPKFRALGGHTAYIEGWALYSEGVPKELGLYTDPYQEFGQLSMEIFRSARLVVDTGIHARKWTRQEAVDYFLENTANSEGDIHAEIDRYIVWPGQATAYKVGMIKIQELRRDAEAQLGDKFDIREFHDVILANGSVPLAVLEELVSAWVESKL